MSGDKLERNKATFRLQQDQVLSKGDLSIETMKRIFAPDFVRHRSGMGHIAKAAGVIQPPSEMSIYERQQTAFGVMLKTFPHQERVIHHVIGEGDLLAARWTIRTTWEGPLLGFAPTGQPVEFEEFGVVRFDEHGLMKEGWFILDELGMLEDLGILKLSAADQNR